MVDTVATPKIETRGLIKEYGKRRVVNKVDVHINAGEIVGLLGPNGAGKTTTFYMVVGLVPATEGKVFLNDDDLTELPMYRRARFGIGYLPQEASVFRKMTVEQNIRAIAERFSQSPCAIFASRQLPTALNCVRSCGILLDCREAHLDVIESALGRCVTVVINIGLPEVRLCAGRKRTRIDVGVGAQLRMNSTAKQLVNRLARRFP